MGEMIQSYIMTNIRTYRQIVKECHHFVIEDMAKRVGPKSDGSPGTVTIVDWEQKGFKKSMICIVFVGIWIEAILHQSIARKLGIDTAEKVDKKIYEEKLKILGITDEDILRRVGEYRKNRKEIVHEKAYLDKGELKTAQDEAIKAYSLLEDLERIMARIS